MCVSPLCVSPLCVRGGCPLGGCPLGVMGGCPLGGCFPWVGAGQIVELKASIATKRAGDPEASRVGVPKQVTEPCANDELVWAPPSRAL